MQLYKNIKVDHCDATYVRVSARGIRSQHCLLHKQDAKSKACCSLCALVCTNVHQCAPGCTSMDQCLISEVSESHLPLPEACPNRPNPGDHCCCLVFLSISTWTSKGIGDPYTGWKTLCTLVPGIRSYIFIVQIMSSHFFYSKIIVHSG